MTKDVRGGVGGPGTKGAERREGIDHTGNLAGAMEAFRKGFGEAVRSGKWMAAVWKVLPGGKVDMMTHTTWDFPKAGMVEAASQLEVECRRISAGTPGVQEPLKYAEFLTVDDLPDELLPPAGVAADEGPPTLPMVRTVDDLVEVPIVGSDVPLPRETRCAPPEVLSEAKSPEGEANRDFDDAAADGVEAAWDEPDEDPER